MGFYSQTKIDSWYSDVGQTRPFDLMQNLIGAPA